MGDYFTKHHAGVHHVNMRKEFLTPHTYLKKLRCHREKACLGKELDQAMVDSSHAMRVC